MLRYIKAVKRGNVVPSADSAAPPPVSKEDLHNLVVYAEKLKKPIKEAEKAVAAGELPKGYEKYTITDPYKKYRSVAEALAADEAAEAAAAAAAAAADKEEKTSGGARKKRQTGKRRRSLRNKRRSSRKQRKQKQKQAY